MARSMLLVVFALVLIVVVADAAVIEKTFHVGNYTIRRLCQERTIIAVNNRLPGPIIKAREGDTVIVHVKNESPYGLTIHWHGIFQLLSAWADGPSFVTQCPVQPGGSYTYKFNITGQEGTLWYHAHVSYLRATVYGALVILPRTGSLGYPFPKPYKEVPIILGEWWNANVVDVERQALATGGGPNVSDAYTINGKPGGQYPCSDRQISRYNVQQGKTYLFRIINAALNTQLFFKVAGHSFTVVAVDASYTNPYHTDVVVLAPGQTIDALVVANAPPATYYMAAHPYISNANVPFGNTTTTAILHYKISRPSPPIMPLLPAFNDTPTANKFYTNMTSLILPNSPKVPLEVDENLFITIGMGVSPCLNNNSVPCFGLHGFKLASSMNNVSFQFPDKLSLLQAHFDNVPGIFTPDFPDRPPLEFDYTGPNVSFDLIQTVKGTRLKKLKFNSSVEIVLQNTALLGTENHPIHLHGFNFFVLAQGDGNYNASVAEKSFNFVNPLIRNTIAVPVGGWAVIRFVADNPGVWFMHCHLDVHLPIGLATGFVVENGNTVSSTLPPPPLDLPQC